MLGRLGYHALVAVLSLQLWTLSEAAENHATRHRGHRGHDQSKMRWDEWSDWSKCTVDCGRGVQTRSRDCRSMEDGRVLNECMGRGREIKLCQFTGCLREAEDIAECKKLESRVFGGKRYRWEPYKHPRDECELACRPSGGAFYIELGINVTDGTACGEKNDHVCVAGSCKPMGCDDIVESGTVVDSCGICGGDSTTCEMVSKTFTDSVKFGYHTVGTIPAGATTISISEKAGGRNYLGVQAVDKSFSINTDFRLSRFGDIPGAGTVFTYSRQLGPDCPDECLRAEGPLNVAVNIIVLFYSDNTGISYSYNVPRGSFVNADKDEDPTQVVHIDGGTIPGTFADGDSRINDEHERTRPLYSSDFKFKKAGRHGKRRQHRKHNNRNGDKTQPDKVNVNITGLTGALNTPKTKTVTSNNGGIIVQSKERNSYVVTVKDRKTIDRDNTPVHVDNANDNEFGTSTGSSNKHDPTDSFIEQNGNATKHASGGNGSHNGIAEDDFGGQPPSNKVGNDDGEDEEEEKIEDEDVDDVDEADAPDDDENAEQESVTEPPANQKIDADMYNNDNRDSSLYSWLISGYTECSETCGTGKQSPVVECIVTNKQARVDDSFCSDQNRPSTAVLECSNGVCPPSWTPRPWSKCSVSCGLGTQSRDFVCQGSEGGEVPQSKCDSPKPDREDQRCDLGSCADGWYYTEWTKECPAKCGYADLTRRVHCSNDFGATCNQRDKPEETRSCRDDNCGGFWVTGPWSKCNATCGLAYQTRPVACAQKHRDRIAVVSEDACQDEERPPTYMSCDLEPCGAQWYMTDWGDCAVSCGDGQRSRDVRCLDDSFNPSSDCDRTNKPVDQERCSSNRACPLSDESRDKPEQTTTKSPKKNAEVQIPEDCQDKFSQCSMVLRAKMCQYKYYQRICCRSCQRSKQS